MRRRDVFAYLTGPITAKNGFSVEDNVSSALTVYLACLNRGIPVFCPHLSAIFPSAHLSVDYETWMAYDFAVIDRCTHIVLLPRWETSSGAVREVEYAERTGKILVSVENLDQL